MNTAWRQKTKKRRYSAPFFAAYFFYYAGYCVFAGYIVLYLTERGYSAGFCGLITSLTMLFNLAMEPLAGYLSDTFLSTRKYLSLCIAAIFALCLVATLLDQHPAFYITALVMSAGLAYPISQLMDAWVSCSRELDPTLIYSRVRAGGSIGFALASIGLGYYFEHWGWDGYFLAQGLFFLILLPILYFLPQIPLGNRKGSVSSDRWLSLSSSLGVILKNRQYLMCLLICTVYWFSHRPIGSYLSLIVADRGGSSSVFGRVCGVGSTVEFLTLLLLSAMQRRNKLPLWWCMALSLLTGALRPLCFHLFDGIWPLYAGQVMQSISFALFFSGSVECFTRSADPRIRSFCISVGLTLSSVVGSVSANLSGGWLCDRFGSDSLVVLSLSVSVINCLLFVLCFPCWGPHKRQIGPPAQC